MNDIFAGLTREIIRRPGMSLPQPKVGKPPKVVRPRISKPPKPLAEPKVPTNPWNLSDQESGIVQRLCDGQGNVEIAAELGMSQPAVEATLRRAREKVGANNRTHLAVLWDRFAKGRS